MYTARKSEMARLRAYRHELDDLYAIATRRHDLARASQLFELRRRVHRAILMSEEWCGESAPAPASTLSTVAETLRRVA